MSKPGMRVMIGMLPGNAGSVEAYISRDKAVLGMLTDMLCKRCFRGLDLPLQRNVV